MLYERLGLDGYDGVEPKLRRYLASISGYQKNRFLPLSPALRQRVVSAWCRSFEEWGYPY